jgi:hypothetical protein
MPGGFAGRRNMKEGGTIMTPPSTFDSLYTSHGPGRAHRASTETERQCWSVSKRAIGHRTHAMPPSKRRRRGSMAVQQFADGDALMNQSSYDVTRLCDRGA